MTSRPYHVCYALTLTFVLLLTSLGISRGTTVDRILATIDDQVITYADYILFTKDFISAQSHDSVDEKLLRQLIEEKLMALEARRKGIEASDGEVEKTIEEFTMTNNLSRDDLESLLKEDGIDLEKFRIIVKDRILISRILENEVDARVLVTDTEIGEFYLSNKKEFLDSPEYVELNAIFLLLRDRSTLTEITDMKRRALRLVALLREGNDFEHLVDEYSDDPLRSNRGALGKFTRGALIPPLDRKAFSMKKGEISDPLWVGDGVFILQLVERTEETYKTVEEVRGTIHGILFKQKREKVFNDWIKALWEKSSVKIFQG
jgi:parvulin-like peptidyl-prolyl isomerase